MVRQRFNRLIISFAVSTLMLFASCGGGGGGGSAPTQPTTATLKLITSGTGTTIYGIDVTVDLPAGVTVKSANPPETDSGVVTVSGAALSGSLATAVYTPASGTTPGKVHILIANAAGFATGEFATLNADIAAGSTPKAADFSLVDFSAIDADGHPITVLTFGFTADIR